MLHIKSTASDASASLIFENTNNAQMMNIDYYNNAGSVQSRIGYDEGPAAFSFKPNVSSTAMYIAYDGKVGIGTTSPAGNLEVVGSTAGQWAGMIRNSANSSAGLLVRTGSMSTAEAMLNVQHGTTSALIVRQIQSSGATGAVGINEPSPAYTLDVNTTGESNAMRLYQGSSNKDASMVIQNQGTDSGSDTLMQLYTAAGAGDPMVRWAISGNETYSMGIDNSDNDNLAITNGSTMGNNTRWKMTAAGYITTPSQPVYGGGRNAGHVANNQVYVADNAHTNVGSHYNTSNGKFTAPVAGSYFLFGNIITHDSGSSDTYVWWAVRKNGSILKYFYDDAEPGRHQQICGTMVITLAASDYIEWYIGNSSNQWYGSQHEYANIGCFLIG